MGNKIVAAAWLVFGMVLSSQTVAQNVDHPFATTDSLQVADKVQINDWKSSPPIPGPSDQVTSRSNLHLTLTTASNTEALRRMPFYATAPYWLPHSRPFKASSDPSAIQPTTQGALINDVVTLVRSASSN